MKKRMFIEISCWCWARSKPDYEKIKRIKKCTTKNQHMGTYIHTQICQEEREREEQENKQNRHCCYVLYFIFIIYKSFQCWIKIFIIFICVCVCQTCSKSNDC